MVRLVLCTAMIGLWSLVIIQDVLQREVSVVVLAAMTLVALHGHAWHWWLLSLTTLLWPWRKHAMLLVAGAVGLGCITGEQPPAMALATGLVAWGLGWWGGADGIVLLALALRGGFSGLIAGSVTTALVGGILMLLRRQSAWGLAVALPNAVGLREVEGGIPPDKEMPAAAAIGAAGLIMEVIALCHQMMCG